MKHFVLVFIISFLSPAVVKAVSPDSIHAANVYESYMVDAAPQFPGGDIAMMKFINTVRQYPQEAYNEGVQGRVRCSFVVNTDGKISDISVIKGVETSLDNEAVRIISEMPKWQAGEINNQPVPVYFILTIPFRK